MKEALGYQVTMLRLTHDLPPEEKHADDSPK